MRAARSLASSVACPFSSSDVSPVFSGDFRAWKDHDAYQQAFTRLLRDLKAESS